MRQVKHLLESKGREVLAPAPTRTCSRLWSAWPNTASAPWW